MKFSTQTTYGLRALIILARNYKKGSIPLSNISKNENISQKYLERIFTKLKKENIVKSEKGFSGGYLLSKNPKKIKIYDIIKAIEGEIAPFYCLENSTKIECGKKCHCKVAGVLLKVKNAIISTLKGIDLSELL